MNKSKYILDSLGPRYGLGLSGYCVGRKFHSEDELVAAFDNPKERERLERFLAVLAGYDDAANRFKKLLEEKPDDDFSLSCLKETQDPQMRISRLMGTWRLFDMGSPLSQIHNDAAISPEEYRRRTCEEIYATTVEPMGWW